MTKPLRIAVAGVGRIGRMHATIVAQRTPGACLAAVFDVAQDLAQDVASSLGVDSASSIDELINSDDVDAIAICTSTDTHVDIAVQAAAAGKAIFCEKPISMSLAEVDRCLTAVDSAGVAFMVGFNRRFDPSHKAVRDAVADGRVGEVRLAHIISRDPAPPPISYIKVSGGMFIDMTIHDFDMARYVVGSPVVRVMAQGAVRVDPAIGEAGDVDTAVTVLTHANGVITTIDNCRQASYGYDQRVEVFGSLGSASSQNLRKNSTEILTAAGGGTEVLPNFFIERYEAAYLLEWQAFVSYVRDGGPSPVPGEAGRAALVLGEAAWASVRSGVPVDVAGG
ncbi:MAG: inositol 2-dehydrogenase [Actinomycetes bacterium]